MKQSFHLLECCKQLERMAKSMGENNKLGELLQNISHTLRNNGTELCEDQVKGAISFIESIATTNFLNKMRHFIYDDLIAAGHWTQQETPPTKSANNSVFNTLKPECITLLKYTHRALAGMLRYSLQNNEIDTDEIKKWRSEQFNYTKSSSSIMDYLREVKITRSGNVSNKKPTKADEVKTLVGNFVDDFLAKNPDQEKYKKNYIDFLLKKGGQEMHGFCMNEFNRSFNIWQHTLPQGHSYVFANSMCNQEWSITEDGEMICDIAINVNKLIFDNSGECWVFDEEKKLLVKLDPENEEDMNKLNNPALPSIVTIKMQIECLPAPNTNHLTLKVREFEMNSCHARNLIVKGHPDHTKSPSNHMQESALPPRKPHEASIETTHTIKPK